VCQHQDSEAEHAWTEAWDELEQERIQQWIECILRHIQQIIELEGDNNYREGKMDKARDSLRHHWRMVNSGIRRRNDFIFI
jgi:hypothetical protein